MMLVFHSGRSEAHEPDVPLKIRRNYDPSSLPTRRDCISGSQHSKCSNQGAKQSRNVHEMIRVATTVLCGFVCCSAAAEPPRFIKNWDPVFRGIEYAELSATTPRTMVGCALRINLRDPTVSFLVTPSNGDKPGETDGLKTSTFLAKYKCRAAINAAPYDIVHEQEGKPVDVVSLNISRGELISAETGWYGGLMMTRDKKIRISWPPLDTNRVFHALAGFQVVLKDGENIGVDKAIHPRTAVGVSKDGNTFYWLVIDGRQPDYSEGATTRDVGIWLARLGAREGLNLDGGGSTTMVLQQPGGSARIMNRPIHNGVPGTERINGSHLGVFADALAETGREAGESR